MYHKSILHIFFFLITSQTLAQNEKTFPQRIVSCTLASDDILLQLLPEPQQRKRLLAVSNLADDVHYSNIKQEARYIAQRTGANIEHVLSLKPDLIVAASYNQPEFISLLKRLNSKVHIMEGFDSLADLKRHTLDLGTLIGEEARAKQLLSQMDKNLSELKKSYSFRTQPKLLILYPNGTLVGKKTLIDDGLNNVGLINLAAQKDIVGWQKISEEALLTMAPDWLVSPGEEKEIDSVLATFAKSPALRQMKAVQAKRIILIPPALFGDFSFRITDSLRRILTTIETQKTNL